MPHEVEPEFKESVQDLCQALRVCCPEEQLLQRFLRDLLTPAEAKRFANRWKAARLLLTGKTQIAVARELDLSPKTVNAVSRFVTGTYATGGFAEADNRLRCGGLEKADTRIHRFDRERERKVMDI